MRSGAFRNLRACASDFSGGIVDLANNRLCAPENSRLLAAEGEARSRHFNPNNKKQLERWANELKRLFGKYQSV
jgi:hypothetical protein